MTVLASKPGSGTSCTVPGFPAWHSTCQRKENREKQAQLADGFSHGFPSLPESSKNLKNILVTRTAIQWTNQNRLMY